MGRKKTTGSKNSTELILDGEQTVQRIAELKKALSAALAETDELVLDLRGVSRADLTFLQLLCSAHRTAQAAGKSVKCIDIPATVDRTLEDAGFIRDDMRCGQDCAESCLWVQN